MKVRVTVDYKYLWIAMDILLNLMRLCMVLREKERELNTGEVNLSQGYFLNAGCFHLRIVALKSQRIRKKPQGLLLGENLVVGRRLRWKHRLEGWGGGRGRSLWNSGKGILWRLGGSW